MNFVAALKASRWIRRRVWAYWIHVADNRERPLADIPYPLTYLDLVANDWVAYNFQQEDDIDDATIRFNLLEID